MKRHGKPLVKAVLRAVFASVYMCLGKKGFKIMGKM